MSIARVPKLIAFDLEYVAKSRYMRKDWLIIPTGTSYTLWDLWIDTHVTGTLA